MTEEKLLTLRDVSLILGISEKEVMDLAESGRIPAYKIGGVYLRFKRDQVEAVKKEVFSSAKPAIGLKDWAIDFFYFYDFYIISFLIILFIIIFIYIGY